MKALGAKRIILLAGGAVAVFLVALLLHLYLCGMLSLGSPHLKPALGYAMVDSILGAWAESGEVGAARSAQALYRGSTGMDADTQAAAGPDDSGTEAEAAPRNPDASPDMLVLDPSTDQAAGSDEEAAAKVQGTMEAPSGGTSPAVGSDPGDALETDVEPLLPFDENKLARLVRVYEKMRPKQVAIILTTMPDRQVVTILSHMKENKAAQVLADMEPGKAARISQSLVNWSNEESE